MQRHSIQEAETGSPREIIKLGYRVGFITREEEWLLMLKKRNLSTHIYNEDIDEMIVLIKGKFIPVFDLLVDELQMKAAEVEE